MHASVRAVFPAFSQEFEGYVEWMYLDVKGLVTIGVGNLIDPIEAALGLVFVDKDTGVRASVDQIKAEWQKLKGMPSLAQQGHKECKEITQLRLTEATIDSLVLRRLDENEAHLKKTFTEWDTWPADAQLGVLSMAWAMGAAFHEKWPTFTAACKKRDFAAAAANCRMKEAGNPGLIRRNDANESLFEFAQKVEALGLDRSILHYPEEPQATPVKRVLDASKSDAAIKFNNRKAVDVLGAFRKQLALPGSDKAYDAELVERIAQLQARTKLEVDGKVGQRTRELLVELDGVVSAEAVWPDAVASVTAKLEHYQALCKSFGHEYSLEKRPLLIGLRGVVLGASHTHPSKSRQAYDDAFVLLAKNGDTVAVREFSGATHPYQVISSLSPDMNKDGKGDVGTVRPGKYVFKLQSNDANHPSMVLQMLDGTVRIPTWRDTDQDGFVEEEEKEDSEKRAQGPQVQPGLGDYALEVLLHPGYKHLKQDGKPYSSIGCQTAPLGDVKAVTQYAEVDYLLVDVAAELRRLGAEPPQA